MSLPLLKASLKSNLKMLGLFMTIMVFYLSMIVIMYDPQLINSMEAMLELLPEQLINALGFEISVFTYNGFLASYYYGMLAVGFPTILTVIVVYRGIGKLVDNKSMAYLLSTPNARTTIALTQAVAIVITLGLLFTGVVVAGIVFSEMLFPGALEITSFLLINIGALLYFFALSGIAYNFSVLFNDSKYSLLFCTAIPVASLLAHMLGQLGGDLEIFRSFTLMTLFDANAMLSSNYNSFPLFILLGIGLAGYALAIVIFKRRNLPL